jgi:alpha-L-rhamnosidase
MSKLRFAILVHCTWLSSIVVLAIFNQTALPAGAADTESADVSASHLRCEFLDNPAGIDVPAPRLSWELRANDPARRGLSQHAYRVLVASSEQLLDHEQGDLWDNKKAISDDTVSIAYAGRPLQSRDRCYWKVKVWDQDDRESGWSERAMWTMGLMQAADWCGKWISAPPARPPVTPHWGYLSLPAEKK